MSKTRSRTGKRKGAASPKSSTSAKPDTSPQTQTKPSRGRKRGPKFRATGGDNDQPRTVPVPAQRTDFRSRLHTAHRAGALRRIGIDGTQLRTVPRIAHILDHAEGGIETVIAALRLSDDDDARKFLDKYDTISQTDRQYLAVEEICLAAEVGTKRLLELAVSALVEDGRSAGAIVAATYHPRVIKKLAEEATGDAVFYDSMGNPVIKSGYRDRHLFLQGTGFLPQPENRRGGGAFNINIVNQNQQATVIPEGDGTVNRFNAAEDDLKVLHETIDGSKLLEAPRVVESVNKVVLGHIYKETSDAVDELECVPVKR